MSRPLYFLFYPKPLSLLFSFLFSFNIRLEAKGHLEGVVRAEEVSRGTDIVRRDGSIEAVGRGLRTRSSRGLIEPEAARVEGCAHLTRWFNQVASQWTRVWMFDWFDYFEEQKIEEE